MHSNYPIKGVFTFSLVMISSHVCFNGLVTRPQVGRRWLQRQRCCPRSSTTPSHACLPVWHTQRMHCASQVWRRCTQTHTRSFL